ncbi:STAS domain-containing protein [Kineosporiaceae bacterium SCSIO 59966]|nr:STAS domain-containing protein [Kineosporiaceae bacterium SCSIO 59966]
MRTFGGDPAADGGSVHVLTYAGTTRVVLSGEIDVALRAELEEAAEAVLDLGNPVEIDAQHVRFLDSTAIAFLARVLARSARPTRVLNPPPMMTFLLESTGLGDLVTVVGSGVPDPPVAGGVPDPPAAGGDPAGPERGATPEPA